MSFSKPGGTTAQWASLTVDAWNRLVSLVDGGDSSLIQQNQYDGRGFRIVTQSYTDGTLSETRHAYFTDQWQIVEERLGTTPDSADPERQFVWGVRYIDDLILRDRSTGGSPLNERLYALQDANWNVTAVSNIVDTIPERYEYDPYGNLTVLSGAFEPRTTSAFNWETTYCGYKWDQSTGLFSIRHRVYHPRLGNWITRDPIGYAGGLSLYLYSSNSPLQYTDPEGLKDPLESLLDGIDASGKPLTARCGLKVKDRKDMQSTSDISDEARLISMCDGNKTCELSIKDLLNKIKKHPIPWFSNKCFRWMESLIMSNWQSYDPDLPIILDGGIEMRPLEFDTIDKEMIVLERRSSFSPYAGQPYREFNSHAVMLISLPNGKAYFDIGSESDLGNFGGDDHIFFDDDEQFNKLMDTKHPRRFIPDSIIQAKSKKLDEQVERSLKDPNKLKDQKMQNPGNKP